jgi:HD-GYP domain-containing protein (c-di-GMP phosphodiesterase class II)
MSKEKRLSEFIAYTVIALSNCSMYSPGHPAVETFSGKALSLIDDLFDDDSFHLTFLADSFLYNDTPVKDRNMHIYRFIKILKLKFIERVVIRKGVSVDEFETFIKMLALREAKVLSSPHITVGMLEVRFTESGNFASLMDRSSEKIAEIYDGVSKFRQLDIRGIEDIVVSFISGIRNETRVLQNLSPVKAHSAYTYVHETNVSILTIFQAEALGLDGEVLYDAGIAGLLHDVGKLFVPKEIIEKQESLSSNEWDIVNQHPVYGSLYLSGLPDVPKVAVIAAYEHHMKYNGSGYPEIRLKIKKQHLISQLVAIADVVDALRSKRSYQQSFATPEIVEILKAGAGKDFNPLLVDNFISACKRSKAF